jgi:hypothetical protein
LGTILLAPRSISATAITLNVSIRRRVFLFAADHNVATLAFSAPLAISDCVPQRGHSCICVVRMLISYLSTADALRRHFNFADPSKRKKQAHKIFWRFLRGLFHDVSYRVRNRRLKRHSPDLHAREIHAHQLTWLKRVLHQDHFTLFQHSSFDKLFFGHQFYTRRRPVLRHLDPSFAPLLRPTFGRDSGYNLVAIWLQWE